MHVLLILDWLSLSQLAINKKIVLVFLALAHCDGWHQSCMSQSALDLRHLQDLLKQIFILLVVFVWRYVPNNT